MDVVEADGLLSPKFRRSSIAVYISIALMAFEGTAIAAALPDMAADLGRLDLLPWVVTLYLFSSGLATIIAGQFIDSFGVRTVYVPSTLAFAIAGFTAGIVSNIWLLLVLRLVQGVAAGFFFAAILAAVNLIFPTRLVGPAMAANTTVWGAMGAVAPAITAAMLEFASWRWVFFINLPLGLSALFLGAPTMPARLGDAQRTTIDRFGVLLLAVFTFLTVIAAGAVSLRSALFLAVALVALYGYWRHSRKVRFPVVLPAHLFEEPYRSLGAVPAVLLAAAFATSLYVPVYASAGQGLGVARAAWTVLFFTLGWTIGANVSSRLSVSLIRVMSGGLGLGIIGCLVAALAVTFSLGLLNTLGALLVVGVGVGSVTNAALTFLRHITDSAQIGRAGAAHQFIRNQGFTLGAASGGALLIFWIARRLGSVELVEDLLAGETVDAVGVSDAVNDAFALVCWVAFAISLVAWIPMRSLLRGNATGDGR